MDFSQQLPIVIHSLNIGFLQTLRLFVITLIGACPLGLAIYYITQSGAAAKPDVSSQHPFPSF